jgi:tetratricopeptide (TPR) repeat protein
VFFRSKNNEVAEQNLIKSTTADPAFAPSYNELGELYYVTKQSAKAVSAQESYLKTTEYPEKGKFKMAFYYFMDKKYPQAVEIFKQLAADPNVTPQVLKYYAYALVESGNLAEAKNIFEQYFKVSKEITGKDYVYYGDLLGGQKLDTLAATNYLNAYRVDSTQVDALKKGADSFYKLKKYDSATMAYQMLLKKEPKTAVYFNLGRSYYLSKNYSAADSAFVKVIELAPNMTVGYLWEARTKAALDPDTKDVLAKKYFDMLIEKALANPDKSKNDLVEAYLYNAAYFIQAKSDLNTAEGYVDKALALDPTNARGLEYKKAIKDAREAQRKAQQQQQKQQK